MTINAPARETYVYVDIEFIEKMEVVKIERHCQKKSLSHIFHLESKTDMYVA